MVEGSRMDMRKQLVVMYQEQTEKEENLSQLTLGDQSYIMDLSNQKHFREARREEEALEEALELYKAAVEDGAPKTKELFKLFMVKVLQELEEEYREKDRLQDEWLDAALQEEIERRQLAESDDLNKSLHTHHDSLGPSFHQPPSIYDGARRTLLVRQQSSARMLALDQQIHKEEIKILKKKIKKAEKLIKEMVVEKGASAAQRTRKYKNFRKKIKEYRTTLKKAEQDELKVSRHSSGLLYDWNATSDEKQTDSSSSSSESSGSNRSATSANSKADLAWAKNVASRNMDDANDENDQFFAIPQNIEPSSEKVKGFRQKNSSFDTAMATTCKMSGHELKIKLAHGDGRQTHVKKSLLSTTPEEDESEALQSPLSALSPQDRSWKSPSKKKMDSPCKRKSPSWMKHSVDTTPVSENLKTGLALSKRELSSPPFLELPEYVAPPKKQPGKNGGQGKHYTLADFREGRVPNSLDTTSWEDFLSIAEFERSFGMSREAFGKLPKWKRLSAKRALRTW